MYLHLIHPDPKFVLPIRNLFEAAASGRHRYFMYARSRRELPVVEDIDVVRSQKELRLLLESRGDWEGIIVNGISEALAPCVEAIPRILKVAWVAWGHELYCLWPSYYRGLYGPLTRQWVAPAWKHSLRPWVWRAQGRMGDFKYVLQRFDIFASQFPQEYDMLQKAGLSYRMQFVDCPVIALENLVDISAPMQQLGPDILVGNSASYSNNYPEIFERLASMGLQGRKVIVPLSYGDSQCRERVLECGQRLLGTNFEPVLEFMPLRQYSRMLKRCGVVIMNHYRQQAVGNIASALWLGAKVYLNDTPIYHRLDSEGLELRLISSQLTPSNPQVFEPLDEEARRSNRERIVRHLSEANVVRKVRGLLGALSTKPQGCQPHV